MREFERALDQRHSIFAAEPQIGDEHINLIAFEHFHRAGDVGGDISIVFILEQSAQPIARMLFVIDDENGGLHLS